MLPFLAIILSMLAIQTLLRNSIDYAGLFPPARLDMETAIRNYAEYLKGEDAWALARFVLPAARLADFNTKAVRYAPSGSGTSSWRLAALVGPDLDGDLRQVATHNERDTGRAALARVEAIEIKASSVAAIEDTLSRVAGSLETYVEIPIEDDPADLVAALSRCGARAKARTGGVTREAFPSATDLVRFMATCLRARVPFKTTAGLHHAMRAEYRLTYAPDSDTGLMFGFLNLFLAAAFLHSGLSEAEAEQVLLETSAGAFQVEDRQVSWRGQILSIAALERARRDGLISFGSCSFSEPLAELRALQLVPSTVQRA